MRKLSSLFTGAALTLTVGVIGCNIEDADPFDSFNPTTTTVGNEETGDGDGDPTTGDGDGDGDPTTGDGDGDPTTGDGDGDPACGGFGEACCAGAVCDDTLTCDASNVCGLGGGDGDGDPTTGGDGNGNYDPALCMPPASLIGVTDIEGIFCSDPCSSDADCASVAPGQGACVLTTPPSETPSNCALLCDDSIDPTAACPSGATCQPVQPGVGICTWPEP